MKYYEKQHFLFEFLNFYFSFLAISFPEKNDKYGSYVNISR